MAGCVHPSTPLAGLATISKTASSLRHHIHVSYPPGGGAQHILPPGGGAHISYPPPPRERGPAYLTPWGRGPTYFIPRGGGPHILVLREGWTHISYLPGRGPTRDTYINASRDSELICCNYRPRCTWQLTLLFTHAGPPDWGAGTDASTEYPSTLNTTSSGTTSSSDSASITAMSSGRQSASVDSDGQTLSQLVRALCICIMEHGIVH